MKSLPKALVVLTLLAALLGLAACSDGGQAADEPGFVYVPEYISLPKEVQNMSNICYYNGVLYFANYGVVGAQEVENPLQPGDPDYYEGMYDIWGSTLCRMNVDGSGYEQLANYKPMPVPDGKQGNSNMSGMTVDKDGNIWVAEQIYMYHTDETGNWMDDGTSNYLRKLDSTGAELAQVDISYMAESQEYFYIGYLRVDSAGNIYVSDGQNTVYVLDSAGQKQFQLSVTNWIYNIAQMGDGSVGVMTYGEQGQVLQMIDAAAKDWGQTINLPYSVYDIYPGSGDYDFYYKTDSNFYGYNLAGKTETKLLNWIGSDIDSSNMNGLVTLEDGRVLCLVWNYDDTSGSSSMELITLTKTDRKDVPARTTLTLAAMYFPYELRSSVINFNKTNTTYRIEVTDYSEYNTQEDYTLGLTKLNTEIISGNVPDIISTSQLPVKQYVAKGLLEDLYPYIDGDGEITRSGLMSNALKVMEIDGGLYQAVPSFYVFTVLGAPSVVGAEMGWTIDEMNQVLADHPESSAFPPYFTRDTVLNYACMFNMDEYVNWETGECNFASDEFAKLLEFTAKFPTEYSWEEETYVDDSELIGTGQVLLMPMSIYDFDQFRMYKAMYGGEVVFKGFPSANSCGSVIGYDTGLAMSSSCKSKDGAWQFIRTVLTKEYQEKTIWYGLPTNKTIFDKKMQDAMTENSYTDENGEVIIQPKSSWGWDGNNTIETYAMTQEEADQVMSLINAITGTMSYDQSIMGIITEETAAFYAGQKSAAETAALIQSRVNIYVNEQR